MKRLKEKWNITSNFQLILILIVFAINGSLSARIANFLMQIIGLDTNQMHWFLYFLLTIILVLPIYPFLLMFFGYLFGQSQFFFPFSKKLLKSIGFGFIFKN